MSSTIVNFSIPFQLEKRIKQRINQQGLASKAEFFRLAAIELLNKDEQLSDEERLDSLVEAVEREVILKFRGKKIPSLEAQLASI